MDAIVPAGNVGRTTGFPHSCGEKRDGFRKGRVLSYERQEGANFICEKGVKSVDNLHSRFYHQFPYTDIWQDTPEYYSSDMPTYQISIHSSAASPFYLPVQSAGRGYSPPTGFLSPNHLKASSGELK